MIQLLITWTLLLVCFFSWRNVIVTECELKATTLTYLISSLEFFRKSETLSEEIFSKELIDEIGRLAEGKTNPPDLSLKFHMASILNLGKWEFSDFYPGLHNLAKKIIRARRR